MKTIHLILVLTLGAYILQSCENDDKLHPESQIVEKVFKDMYPEAIRVDWEKKGNYEVVDFLINNNDTEAWFDQDGNWLMAETDIRLEDLPQAVKEAFSTGEYSTWRIDDIDKIERKGMEVIYVLEIEKANQEYDLYYSAEGLLVKTVLESNDRNDNSGYLPATLSEKIKAYISTHYPQARILETEKERNMIEVDIIDGSVHRELMFSEEGEWAYSKTGIRKNSIPQIVSNALTASEYGSYTIDDIYYFETPLRNYYFFELEFHSKEVDLIITPEGQIEIVKISND